MTGIEELNRLWRLGPGFEPDKKVRPKVKRNPNVGQNLFSAAEVLRIRTEADAGVLNTRGWANAKNCAPETIRKIARRDTYTHVQAPTDSTAKGGSKMGEDSAHPGEDDVSPEEVAASLARFQKTLEALPRDGREVDGLLDELTRKGGEK